MIQFYINNTNKFSAAEQAQMALEAGCRWIEINPKAIDEKNRKEELNEIVTLCRESETFLVINDNVELAEEMHVHGITLSESTPSYVASVRERLGAEAIIGVWCNDGDKAVALKRLDIDYLLTDFAAERHSVAPFAAMLERMLAVGVKLHLVAVGDFTADEMRLLRAAGVSGFALTSNTLEVENPEAALAALFSSI